jgi:hypothetical protein
MRTPRIVLAVTLCLALVAATQGQTPAPSNPYYPLKPGTTWTYRNGKIELIIRVASVDKGLANLETVLDGKVRTTEQLGIDRDALARFSFKGAKIRPPVPILKSTPKAGDSWEVASTISEDEAVKGKVTVTEGNVTVPAGTYEKVLVVNAPEMEANGVKISLTTYYAKEVGLVKQVTEIAGKTSTLELVKFEVGKGADRPGKTTEKKK